MYEQPEERCDKYMRGGLLLYRLIGRAAVLGFAEIRIQKGVPSKKPTIFWKACVPKKWLLHQQMDLSAFLRGNVLQLTRV